MSGWVERLGATQVKTLVTLASSPPDLGLGDRTELGPYQIVGRLGKGGMGEVYRAHDRRLNRTVAIKIVTGAPGGELRKRFVREAQATARIEHPHVCRVYDVGHDRDLDYLVMEYLEGETLARRLEQGPLPAPEAITIAKQTAEALACMHERGLVHRDLTPGNIMLTPTGAKVLDFGLSSPARAVTATVAGTLQYMAPEQVDGQPATEQSDIFALGTILYEMLTGRPAFAADNASATIAAILHRQPMPLRQAGVVLPRVDAILAKCLAKSPGDRWPSAETLAAALPVWSDTPAPSRRFAAALIAVLVVSMAAVWSALSPDWYVPRQEALAAATDTARRSVAVLGFGNRSGRNDGDWLSAGLSEMLTAELTAGGGLRVVSDETIVRTKRELHLTLGEAYPPSTLAQIKNSLDADLIVTGSFLLAGDAKRKVDLHLQVLDTKRGRLVTSITDGGSDADVAGLVSRVAGRLRADLGIAALSTEESASVRAVIPSGTEAIRLYAQGLEKFRAFDAIAARDLLTRAVQADPTNAVARSALAAAWSALGYDGRAREEARQAAELAGTLPREQRLPIEARARALAGDAKSAVESYQALWQLHPDNLDYGLALADAQRISGAPREALATIATLRQLPPPWGTDPRIDHADAVANMALGNFPVAHEMAMSAASRAAERGAPLLVADARRVDSSVLWRMSRLAEARASATESQRLAREAGDKHLEGLATVILGNVYYAEGNYRRAKPTYQQAIALFRAIGRQAAIDGTLNNIANIDHLAGDFDGAERAYDESLRLSRELGRKGDMAMTLTNLGLVIADRGDLRRAIARHSETLAAYREVGDKSGIESTLLILAQELREAGDPAESQRRFVEAVRLGRETNQKITSLLVLSEFALLTAYRGDLPGAAALCDDAFALARAIGSKAIRPKRVCAIVALEDGRLDDAARLAKESGSSYTMAQVHLAAGTIEDARQAFGRTTPEGPAEWRHGYAITAARLRAADAPDEAVAALQTVVDEATRTGYLRLAFEARLHAAHIERQAGLAGASRTSLERLKRDAAAVGFTLTARKAAALLRQPLPESARVARARRR